METELCYQLLGEGSYELYLELPAFLQRTACGTDLPVKGDSTTGSNGPLCGTTHGGRREIIAGQQFEGQHADSGFPVIRGIS